MVSDSNATVTVHKFELSPKLYKRIPLDERVCFLTLGHISNELSILRKLVLISDRSHGSSEIEKHAQATQSLLLIKLFALKSCAGYEFVKKQTRRPFMKKYLRDPDSGLSGPILKLNQYFKGDNLLKYMRNKFVAHYDDKVIEDLVANSSDQIHHLYVANQQGLSLYFAAEEKMFEALATQVASGEEIKDVMGRLIDDVNRVAGLLTDCAQGVMIVIGKRYAKSAWKPAKITSEKVALVNAETVTLPFFIDFAPLLKE